MDPLITLKSSDSPATLTFERDGADTLVVRVERPEVSATVRVYSIPDYGSPASLADFLEGVARDWRGWDGIRTWSSLEGDFKLSCYTDRLGHTFATVHLQGQLEGEPWSVGFQINTEASQIAPVARAIREAFAT